MKPYLEVDEEGLIVETHLFGEEDHIPSNCFEGWGDRVFYKPRWDYERADWVEALTPEEIYNLTKPKPTPPSESERMDALEFMVMEMMMKQQMQEMIDMQPPDLKL